MKRLFTSFAIEDEKYRDLLKGQAENKRSPFEFVDMSVKEPWNSAWKTKCHSRIKSCRGMFILVSKNTKNADGQLWEIKCAKKEHIPMRGIYTNATDRPSSLPPEFSGVQVVDWKWKNIEKFMDEL